jgi:hypothetical protein
MFDISTSGLPTELAGVARLRSIGDAYAVAFEVRWVIGALAFSVGACGARAEPGFLLEDSVEAGSVHPDAFPSPSGSSGQGRPPPFSGNVSPGVSLGQPMPVQPTHNPPVVGTVVPDPVPPNTPPVGASGVECVDLPVPAPLPPRLSFEESCARAELLNEISFMVAQDDARPMLVGRWELCVGDALFAGQRHSGFEFGSNGRMQLLRRENGRLVPVPNGPTGTYFLLGSGQFMTRGAVGLESFSTFVHFDATLSVLELEGLRYARVNPDLQSAEQNRYSVSNGSCSMVGVWDDDGSGPQATYAFNDEGEWIGGARQTDLCVSHFMSGTYQLTGNEFELVTNFGAGRCAYWFGAGFSADFSPDCQTLWLRPYWDNCTGGRGYLNDGAVLRRRESSHLLR